MKYLLLITLLINTQFSVAAYEREVPELDDVTHYIEEVATPDEVLEEIKRLNQPAPAPSEEIVLIEEIINLGEKIWKIIEANKPVVNVSHHYANALPKGVRGSEDLEGFSDVQFKSYRMFGKNLYGIVVYDVTYTLLHRYGGTYQRRGRYLENVTVLPHKVDVLWGYTVNFGINNVFTVNSGSQDEPIASLLMESQLKVSTVIKHSEVTSTFQFRGDSPAVKLTNPGLAIFIVNRP